jgi:EpsI family protein
MSTVTVSRPSQTTALPTPAVAALGLLAAGAGAVVWSLARFWGTNPEYADRFLILGAAGYLAWQARPDLAALPVRPARLGLVPILVGAAAFPVGWFLQAQVSPRPVVLWWLAAAWLLAAVGVVLVLGGWQHLRRLAFPLVFVLFALPIPNRILVPLQFYLQSATTWAAAGALPALGIPVVRSGFVLGLPGGDLGVVEACSGVRSVTALTAIAAFVAHWNGFGLVRGLILLGLSVPVIAAVNAARVVISGLLQEHVGPEAIAGVWHEVLGVAMVLLGLLLVLGLAKLLGRGRELAPHPGASEGGQDGKGGKLLGPLPGARLGLASSAAALVLVVAAGATIAAQFLGRQAEQEQVAAAPLDQIPYTLGRWKGGDAPIPEYVPTTLTYDTAVHRVYRDPVGYDVHVWVVFWSSQKMVRGYHHPDICIPNKGMEGTAAREVVPVPVPSGGTVPVTLRVYAGEKHRQLILYWTQEGRRVWTEEDERAAQLTGDSHDWLGERLFRRTSPAATGRLVVLLGTPTWGDGAAIRDQTLELAGLLADAVYRVCPWAAVAPPGGSD